MRRVIPFLGHTRGLLFFCRKLGEGIKKLHLGKKNCTSPCGGSRP